jgi:hypothetical protein
MKRSLPLIVAVAVYAIAVVVWLAADRRVPRQAFDEYSADNTSAKGLSLARRYLAAHGGHRVELLKRPIEARFLPKNGVVLRAGELVSFLDFMRQGDEEREEKRSRKAKQGTPPAKARRATPKRKLATPILSSDEEEWVRGGGRLVLATSRQYGGIDVRNATASRATKVFPIWRGVDSIVETEARTLSGDAVLRAGHTLYTIGRDPAIVRIAAGSGDVIIIPSPELFTNEHIASNLPLLGALAGERRPVFFDEVVHGQSGDDGVLPLMKDWNLGPFLLLALTAFLLQIWRKSVAVGPREDDFRDTRSEAVDLVDSLGALYQQSMKDGQAIALYHQALTKAVAAQSRLRGEPLHRRVNELTGYLRVPGKHEKLDDDSFTRSLTKINEAFGRIEHADHR